MGSQVESVNSLTKRLCFEEISGTLLRFAGTRQVSFKYLLEKKEHKLYLRKDQTQTSDSVTVTAKSNVSAHISDETKCRSSKDKKKKVLLRFQIPL